MTESRGPFPWKTILKWTGIVLLVGYAGVIPPDYVTGTGRISYKLSFAIVWAVVFGFVFSVITYFRWVISKKGSISEATRTEFSRTPYVICIAILSVCLLGVSYKLVDVTNSNVSSVVENDGDSFESDVSTAMPVDSESIENKNATKLQEIRKLNPQYDAVDDVTLAIAIYEKNYTWAPWEEFRERIGLSEKVSAAEVEARLKLLREFHLNNYPNK